MTNLLQLYQQYKTYLFPGNPVTRSVLRNCIKDRVTSLNCPIVYRYLAIEWEE